MWTTRESWSRPRRVVAKAEWTNGEANPRFVVTSLTRADAHEFLDVAPKAGVKTQVVRYPLADANTALDDLRGGRLQGAAVLIP